MILRAALWSPVLHLKKAKVQNQKENNQGVWLKIVIKCLVFCPLARTKRKSKRVTRRGRVGINTYL